MARQQRVDLRTLLAEHEHEQWRSWMRWLLHSVEVDDDGRWVLPDCHVQRWLTQMEKSYGELSDVEKEEELAEADRILSIMRSGIWTI